MASTVPEKPVDARSRANRTASGTFYSVNETQIRQLLEDAAHQAATLSISPYSSTKVGAAALTHSHDVITGANLESAAWVPGLHAETSVVAQWQMQGCPLVTHLFVVALEPSRVLSPCGMCRQLLVEHFGADVMVCTIEGWVTLGSLLPLHFGAKDLS